MFWNKLVSCFNLEVHAYTLMPNHYHLLVHTPLGNLSRAMRHLKWRSILRNSIKRYDIDGGTVSWDAFKSILVEEESYLLELGQGIYIGMLINQSLKLV